MNRQAKILVVDDTPMNVKFLADLLAAKGYAVVTAASGAQALEMIPKEQPDLVLLDVMMPEMNGYDVCQQLRENSVTKLLPVVLVTALDQTRERVKGIEAGADDFITKPINEVELLARVRSLLRIKELHDTIQSQAGQLAEWNKTLELRVQEQVAQIERLGQLKRFFSPQLAQLIIAGGTQDPLRTHRCDVSIVFLDLRGFTTFAESTEPEEVMGILQEYHAEMGCLILDHKGTLERFTGDGMMIIFNDPIQITNPEEQAVRMAVAMQDKMANLCTKWQKRGCELGFGVGIASGFTTIGAIGFEGRSDYAAIGPVTNLAARLCGKAMSRQTLVSQRVFSKIENVVDAESVGTLTLKGLHRPVLAYNIVRFKA